nr:YihY/virulence factor BrkB family protein [Gloeothece citriformis]
MKETFKEWQDDNASRLAASLAYYTIISLAPLLILVIAIAGAVFGEEAARGQIVYQIQGLVGIDGARVIETAIENSNKPEIRNFASLISIGVLLFGASGVFAELQDALNTIWEVKVKPGQGVGTFIRKRILSFSAILGIGFLLLVSLVISAILSAFNSYFSHLIPGLEFIWQIVNFVVSFGVITLLFGFMFKFLPDAKIAWRDVWMGAIITALLFSIGKYALGAYLGGGSFGSTYGAAGSLVVILVWVYYSAQILFFGAEFTQVYAKRYGSKIVPDKHAMPIN